jgi:hypothetical protein
MLGKNLLIINQSEMTRAISLSFKKLVQSTSQWKNTVVNPAITEAL